MKTVVTNREIPHLWAHQSQPSARNGKGSFYFNGATIYSYRDSWPLASWIANERGDRAVVWNPSSYGNTTAHHLSMVRRSIPNGVLEFALPGLGHYVRYGEFRPDHYNAVEQYRQRLSGDIASAARARSHKEWKLQKAVDTAQEANAYLDFFGLSDHRFEIPSDWGDIREQLAKAAAEKAAETRKREAELKREYEREIAAWLNGHLGASVPWGLKDAYLRIDPRDTMQVETSKGARFPLDHAVHVAKLLRRLYASGVEYRRNGHTIHLGHYALDRVDLKGNIHAGCHHITRAEADRFIALLEALPQWEQLAPARSDVEMQA